MFYDRLDALCAENGLTVTELMKLLGLSPSSASRWKNRGFLPSRSAAKRIADYFGVTVQELMDGEAVGKEPIEKPAIQTDDGRTIDEKIIELWEGFTDAEREDALAYWQYLKDRRKK